MRVQTIILLAKREREREYTKYSYFYRRLCGLGEYSKGIKTNVGVVSERQQKYDKSLYP